ncbi:calmodulin-lysine N-methyltransferase-like [Amphiura filiformis]|uniref:calmodulin-lysine N-methyltransferase-like n=1 Tax=Amphiura filiformis TaxID=82378 RepID=UPI003B20FAC7
MRGRENTKCNSNAKKRWQILKQALLQRQKSAVGSGDTVSVRRFSTFELLSTKLISTNEQEHLWLQYNCSVFPEFNVDIRHLTQQVKVDDLIGFNNTGNVCVWPSEEVLSYYCLKNKHLFRNQNVCELGGGMTCLAGVIVAVCSDASHVLLTDGNENSVTNVSSIIERNKTLFGKTEVTGRELKWNEREKFDDLSGQYDHIICADCLFFDQYRQDLVDTIDCLLKPGGTASIFAPYRGTTLQAFCDLAKVKFNVDVQLNYDATLWQKHQQMLTKGKEIYDENIHYPVFITLTKMDAKELKTN